MVSMIDKRKALLQGLWRKAYEGEKPVVIKLKDRKEANRIRFDLYGSVRDVKENHRLDPSLAEATIGCVISYLDEKTLQISRRSIEDALMEAAEACGIKAESLTPAPKTEAEAEFRTAAAGGMMDRLARTQAEADAKEAASRHEGGIPMAYEGLEPAPEAEIEPAKPVDIAVLQTRYGHRGAR